MPCSGSRECTRLCRMACSTFGGPSYAAAWLLRPCLALEGRLPALMLLTFAGRQQVQDLLTRLESNVYT